MVKKPSKSTLTPAIREKLANLPSKNSRFTTIQSLPRWVKACLTVREMRGLDYNSAASQFGRKGATLSSYAITPAGKEWRASVNSIASDPAGMAEMILRSTLADAGLDYIWALEVAKERRDYKEVRLATKDLLQTYDILKPSSDGGGHAPVVIQINLGSEDIAPPEITSMYTIEEDKIEWEIPEV